MEMSLDRVQWSAKRMKGTSTNASSKHTRLIVRDWVAVRFDGPPAS